MTRGIRFLVAVLILAGTNSALGQAQSVFRRTSNSEGQTELSAIMDRVTALENENQRFKTQLQQFQQNNGSSPESLATTDQFATQSPFGGRWTVGYDHVITKPYFARNIAYWNEVPPGFTISEMTSFDWDAKYTPRVYFGYRGENGAEMRVRYWAFDGDSSFTRLEQAGEDLNVETNLADNGALMFVDGTLTGRHSIQTKVWDIEFAKKREFGWGWLEGVGGLRYMRLEQEAFWSESGGAEFILLQYDFEGFGPTIAVEGGIPLFNTGLSLFMGGRTSLLFGNRSGFVTDDLPNRDIIPSYDSLLPVIDGRVGLEYGTCVLGSKLTLRTALESQTLFGGGSASGGDDEGTAADQINMGFFGASFIAIIEF